jgi:hypothetical protein
LGTSPQVCHIHAAAAPIGKPFTRKQQTAEDVLDELLHSKDETIRLRAADAFLKRQERQTACPRCAAERERGAEHDRAIRRLTYEQRCQVKELMQTVRDILELARRQPLTLDPDRGYIDNPAPEPITAPPPVVADEPVYEEPEDAEEQEVEDADDRDPLTVPPPDEV